MSTKIQLQLYKDRIAINNIKVELRNLIWKLLMNENIEVRRGNGNPMVAISYIVERLKEIYEQCKSLRS